MGKAMVVFAAVLMLSALAAVNAGKTEDVTVEFQSGFGIRIAVYNPNNYSIYSLALEKVEIAGIVVFGHSPGVVSVNEVKPHSLAYLSFLVFGFGEMFVTAYISYEENGERVNREIHCQAMVIGPIVLVLQEW